MDSSYCKFLNPYYVMIKKRMKEFLSYFLAENENITLEHRLFLSTLVYGILICIIGIILSAILILSKFMIIISLLVLCILCIVYYFVRFKRIIKPFIIPIIVISFIGISGIWVLGGGIDGSNIIIWIVALILALIVAPEKLQKYVITLFLLLLTIVYLIQFYRPDLIIKFPSENKRWLNSFLTITYSSLFIYIIIKYLLNHYNIERKRAEENEKQLLQINTDKDRFISILGHDLKNPFNNILGFSEILTDEIDSLNKGEIKDIAHNINKSAQITYKLLDDILMWARAQQGKTPFSPQKLGFAEICNGAVEVLKPIADAKNISINYSKVDNITVFADRDMIKTIFRNLVSNAIKFTNNDGVININAEQTQSNITISVTDNGIGIASDNLVKLFDISDVLTTKGTAGETGTGLGLLLCKEFVEKHGGKIWVESEVGKGSDFKFKLPIFNERCQ